MGGLPIELIPDSHVAQTEGSQIGDHILSPSCNCNVGPNINLFVNAPVVIETNQDVRFFVWVVRVGGSSSGLITILW